MDGYPTWLTKRQNIAGTSEPLGRLRLAGSATYCDVAILRPLGRRLTIAFGLACLVSGIYLAGGMHEQRGAELVTLKLQEAGHEAASRGAVLSARTSRAFPLTFNAPSLTGFRRCLLKAAR